MKAKIIPPRGLFLPFQSKWLHDTSRLKIAEKSRQIGWTWTTAASLIHRKCLGRSRLDSWISSRDELQAKLFLEDCKKKRSCSSPGGPWALVQSPGFQGRLGVTRR